MINSEFYHLKFLLKEGNNNPDNFKHSKDNDYPMLKDFDHREIIGSPYHLLWMVQWYENRDLDLLQKGGL